MNTQRLRGEKADLSPKTSPNVLSPKLGRDISVTCGNSRSHELRKEHQFRRDRRNESFKPPQQTSGDQRSRGQRKSVGFKSREIQTSRNREQTYQIGFENVVHHRGAGEKGRDRDQVRERHAGALDHLLRHLATRHDSHGTRFPATTESTQLLRRLGAFNQSSPRPRR